jgi:hypothetical protein
MLINYPSTKELEFYIQLFGLLMEFANLWEIKTMSFLFFFIDYSKSFIKLLFCCMFSSSLCLYILCHLFFILFAIGSCLICAPLLLKSVDSWCFIHHHLRGWQWWVVLCQYCFYWSHAFFCKKKKGKFRNIKIKRNSFHNFGNYYYKLARIIQDFRKPCTLKECNQILNQYGF